MTNGSQRSQQADQAAMEIEKAAMRMGNFNSFTGGQGTQSRTVNLKDKSKHQQAIFNLVIGGNIPATGIAATGLSTISLELFYAQNSASKLNYQALNTLLTNNQPIDGNIVFMPNALSGGALNPQPGTQISGGIAAAAGSFLRGYSVFAGYNPANWGNNPGTVTGFDALGQLNLIIPTSGATAIIPVVTIGCIETSYRSIFEYSGVHSFNIDKIRMTATQANGGSQFKNAITWAKATWLGGVSKQVISPQSFNSPFQQQPNIIDIVKTPLKIDKQKGLQININAQEIPGTYGGTGLTMTCWCDLYTQSEI